MNILSGSSANRNLLAIKIIEILDKKFRFAFLFEKAQELRERRSAHLPANNRRWYSKRTLTEKLFAIKYRVTRIETGVTNYFFLLKEKNWEK